jgi:hypothetical protein
MIRRFFEKLRFCAIRIWWIARGDGKRVYPPQDTAVLPEILQEYEGIINRRIEQLEEWFQGRLAPLKQAHKSALIQMFLFKQQLKEVVDRLYQARADLQQAADQFAALTGRPARYKGTRRFAFPALIAGISVAVDAAITLPTVSQHGHTQYFAYIATVAVCLVSFVIAPLIGVGFRRNPSRKGIAGLLAACGVLAVLVVTLAIQRRDVIMEQFGPLFSNLSPVILLVFYTTLQTLMLLATGWMSFESYQPEQTVYDAAYLAERKLESLRKELYLKATDHGLYAQAMLAKIEALENHYFSLFKQLWHDAGALRHKYNRYNRKRRRDIPPGGKPSCYRVGFEFIVPSTIRDIVRRRREEAAARGMDDSYFRFEEPRYERYEEREEYASRASSHRDDWTKPGNHRRL